MKKILFFLIALCFATISCTLDKTDYESEIITIIPEQEFKEVLSLNYTDIYQIDIEALDGKFYTGYNEIRIKVTDKKTNENITASDIKFIPIHTNADRSRTIYPHGSLVNKSKENIYSGFAVFTEESNLNDEWEIFISFTIANQTHKIQHKVSINKQYNKNLNINIFNDKNNNNHIIALVSPRKPKVGENELIAGIYKLHELTKIPSDNFPEDIQFSYAEVDAYTLQLDPRMPEPSMGNHSSPNNQNLTQQQDGFYHGVVNYTMTGNWTLNFIMLNGQGQILKGTVVPTDFTPGIEGVKSDLFIDILF